MFYLGAGSLLIAQPSVFYWQTHLKTVSVGQPDGLLALPGQRSSAHANTQAELRNGWRRLGRRQRVGCQRCFDHALSQPMNRVYRVQDVVFGRNGRTYDRLCRLREIASVFVFAIRNNLSRRGAGCDAMRIYISTKGAGWWRWLSPASEHTACS